MPYTYQHLHAQTYSYAALLDETNCPTHVSICTLELTVALFSSTQDCDGVSEDVLIR